MKKIIFIIACFFITAKLLAQDCTQYVYMQKGKTIETSSYGMNSIVTGKTVHYITDVTTAGGTTTATVNSEFFDKNGNSRGKKVIYYKCTGGALMMDMSAMNSQQGSVKMTTTYIAYPANMKVGDHFEDVSFDMEMTIGGQTHKGHYKLTDRQVVGQESITTPAGTWNCFKITYKTTTAIEGTSMPAQSIETTEWYAPNFGIVQFQVGKYFSSKITGIH